MHSSKLVIAQDIRRKLEIYAEKYGYSLDLCGLCALGAGTLHFAFLKKGFKSKVVWGVGTFGAHCFVESDGKIWDVTATQFSFGKDYPVFVCNVGDNRYKQFYRLFKDRNINSSPRFVFPLKLNSHFQYWFQLWMPEEQPVYDRILEVMRCQY